MAWARALAWACARVWAWAQMSIPSLVEDKDGMVSIPSLAYDLFKEGPSLTKSVSGQPLTQRSGRMVTIVQLLHIISVSLLDSWFFVKSTITKTNL